jgi:hypothetical protein
MLLRLLPPANSFSANTRNFLESICKLKVGKKRPFVLCKAISQEESIDLHIEITLLTALDSGTVIPNALSSLEAGVILLERKWNQLSSVPASVGCIVHETLLIGSSV